MKRIRLYARALWLLLNRAYADPTPDYDLASSDYDDFFSRVMGTHSMAMLAELDIHQDQDIIELACGTGHLTAAAGHRLDGGGSIRAVDKSEGMLAVAGAKMVGFENLRVDLSQGDMMEFLAATPAESADVVVCGWGICYVPPARFLREVRRVLRPGGQVGIIETRADAMAPLMHVFEEVVAADPSVMRRYLSINLPKNVGVLRQWFEKAGLEVGVMRDGSQPLPPDSAEAAVEWVERSGAAAGFRDSFDPGREEEMRTRLRLEMERYITRHGGIELNHTFVYGVACRAASVAEADQLGAKPALAPAVGD
jgi:ubiquinone/menaquinone biosynthesis C-methylase UbiE